MCWRSPWGTSTWAMARCRPTRPTGGQSRYTMRCGSAAWRRPRWAPSSSVGQLRDWPALGAFQIGSTPDGAVTADVLGDTTPIYVSSIGGIVRRLVQSLGPLFADSDISSDAFAFARTRFAKIQSMCAICRNARASFNRCCHLLPPPTLRETPRAAHAPRGLPAAGRP